MGRWHRLAEGKYLGVFCDRDPDKQAAVLVEVTNGGWNVCDLLRDAAWIGAGRTLRDAKRIAGEYARS